MNTARVCVSARVVITGGEVYLSEDGPDTILTVVSISVSSAYVECDQRVNMSPGREGGKKKTTTSYNSRSC